MRYIFRKELFIKDCTIDGTLSKQAEFALESWVKVVADEVVKFHENASVGNCWGFTVHKDWCEVIE